MYTVNTYQIPGLGFVSFDNRNRGVDGRGKTAKESLDDLRSKQTDRWSETVIEGYLGCIQKT